MKNKKKETSVPETINQHIESELQKSDEFKKAYEGEKRISALNLGEHLRKLPKKSASLKDYAKAIKEGYKKLARKF
ncbi:MAG: hypothetical protein P9X22_08170 [Candidatus Zapsychrus exili]|nr:hypothetical protein [Candidatus Zapsychrus exili]